MRTRFVGTLVLAFGVMAGCTAPAGTPFASNEPDLTSVELASTIPTAIESPGPSQATVDATPAATTVGATTFPSAAATAQPAATAKTGVSTCTTTVKDPVYIGDKAKITAKCPVGPTCALMVHYPNGQVAALPSPTHPSPGWWQWTWTIPANAKAGEARGVTECIQGGVRRAMDADFTVKAVPWSIQVYVPATFDHTSLPEVGLEITVTIVGTLPENGSYDVQDVLCSMDLSAANGTLHHDGFEVAWKNGDPPIQWHWQTTFETSEVGTAQWTMKCRNYYVDPAQWKYDSGTMAVT